MSCDLEVVNEIFRRWEKTNYKRMVNKNNNFMTAANLLPRSFFNEAESLRFCPKNLGTRLGRCEK